MEIPAATAQAFRLLFSGDPDLWGIIALSLGTSLAALALTAPLAVAAAHALAARRFPGRRLLLVLLQGLLSFPTVVVGLVLYILLSRHGPLGGLELLFTPQAIVIGQTLIAFPILAVFAFSALQKNGAMVRETARSLGAGAWRTLAAECYEARFGLCAALFAGFGRVISEIGCALMVGGNIAHYTRTIPTAIALETGKGKFAEGIALGIVLIALALLAGTALSIAQGRGE